MMASRRQEFWRRRRRGNDSEIRHKKTFSNGSLRKTINEETIFEMGECNIISYRHNFGYLEKINLCGLIEKVIPCQIKMIGVLFLGLSVSLSVNCELVKITSVNHDVVMRDSRLAFVAFTASWCPFSQNLLNSFTESARIYTQKYPNKKTVWGNVDCMEEDALSNKYGITKFPTMKVFFYGHLMTEYRGSRHSNALIQYVEQMENTTNLVDLKAVESLTQWQIHNIPTKGTLILWFPRGSPPFELILKAIALIHDQLTVVVPVATNLLEHEEHKLWFSLDGEHVQQFNGSITSFNEIVEWIKQKSVGMVRELTFSNMEELVEEAKPMLILLRNPNDKETDVKFVQAFVADLFNDTHHRKLHKKVEDLLKKILSETEKLERAAQLEEKTTETPNLLDQKESVFKQLKPAKNRYSFAKEEL
ncbi:hypothetical protein CAEBREN_22983 [Caenorhabditis brenneri]|uniref:Thioredoxin domain-containing protein n=1 Tax=Caenorhabditis brenneri TaxID=135651 RepID=G0PBC5_CAEBE|nr:hypothetical protein CAEBREN_22983 [Caenorhabditis brenneri]